MGGLIKRLDTGEGSYAKELEEDYDVAEQLDQVCRMDCTHVRTRMLRLCAILHASLTRACCMRCALAQVLSITLTTIGSCEAFKQQYTKYEFLWKQDLHQALQVRRGCAWGVLRSGCCRCAAWLLLLLLLVYIKRTLSSHAALDCCLACHTRPSWRPRAPRRQTAAARTRHWRPLRSKSRSTSERVCCSG